MYITALGGAGLLLVAGHDSTAHMILATMLILVFVCAVVLGVGMLVVVIGTELRGW